MKDMEKTLTEKYGDLDPDEVIHRLKRLLELYDKAIEKYTNNEKELSSASLSRD